MGGSAKAYHGFGSFGMKLKPAQSSAAGILRDAKQVYQGQPKTFAPLRVLLKSRSAALLTFEGEK